MKVEVKEAPKKFQPFKLEITIETPEELMIMWHRHNLGSADQSYMDRYGQPNFSGDYPMYHALEVIRTQLGIPTGR